MASKDQMQAEIDRMRAQHADAIAAWNSEVAELFARIANLESDLAYERDRCAMLEQELEDLQNDIRKIAGDGSPWPDHDGSNDHD